MNFWISVSPESVHTHERFTTQRIQPLHPDLISEIHRLVRKGETSIPVIKCQLSSFVQKMFLKSSIRPDTFNTAFYPCDKSIYNHVYEAKAALLKQQEETLQSISPPPSTSASSAVASAPHQEHEINEVIIYQVSSFCSKLLIFHRLFLTVRLFCCRNWILIWLLSPS